MVQIVFLMQDIRIPLIKTNKMEKPETKIDTRYCCKIKEASNWFIIYTQKE